MLTSIMIAVIQVTKDPVMTSGVPLKSVMRPAAHVTRSAQKIQHTKHNGMQT